MAVGADPLADLGGELRRLFRRQFHSRGRTRIHVARGSAEADQAYPALLTELRTFGRSGTATRACDHRLRSYLSPTISTIEITIGKNFPTGLAVHV